MIINHQAVADQARSYIGTRWRHQGRSRLHGLDCFGLLWRVAEDLGCPISDETGYARVPNGFSFVEGMRARFDPIKIIDAQSGDVLVFHEQRYPCHTGIVVPNRAGVPANIVHAHARRRSVVEEPLVQEWGMKAVMAFRFWGVT